MAAAVFELADDPCQGVDGVGSPGTELEFAL